VLAVLDQLGATDPEEPVEAVHSYQKPLLDVSGAKLAIVGTSAIFIGLEITIEEPLVLIEPCS
jgi:hypothetical protein